MAARVEPADGLVRAGARKSGGSLTIVAANAGYGPAHATITVPGLAGRALTVVGTGRRIEPDGDTFVERFRRSAARVYVTRG